MKLNASIFRISTTQLDWLACLFVFTLSFIIFYNAKDSFSYDYINYINYLNRLNDFTTQDIFINLSTNFPYVLIPPSGLFEIGFITTARLLLFADLESVTTYALIGATSVAIRIILLRKIGVSWALTALISIYSTTLFEANAIRLGCAVTILMAAVLALKNDRKIIFFILITCAALFHIQTLALTIPLTTAFYCLRLKSNPSVNRMIFLIIFVFGSVFFAYNAQRFIPFKLDDYIGIKSLATGLNTISILSIITIVAGIWIFIKKNDGNHSIKNTQSKKIWGSVLISTIPSLALLVIGTNLGAIGDRLWQVALVFLVATIPLLKEKKAAVKCYKSAIIFCLLFLSISVTIRYPLSNFFAPIIPYREIDPLFLVL